MKKNALTTVTALTEEVIAETINNRFEEVKRTANNLRMQMLGVGFTLVQAERELEKMGKLKKNWNTSGIGMQEWLAVNCPAIPYKTAMDWKNLAEKSLKKIGGDEGAALALMLEGPDGGRDGARPSLDVEWTEAQVAARDEIYSCETKGALKQMLMPFFSGAVGRPKGSVIEPDQVCHVTDAELCERLWGTVGNALAPMDRLCALVREMDYQHIQAYIVMMQNALRALQDQKKKLEAR